MKQKIIRKIQLYCKKGMNRGKPLGKVIYEKDKEPYYYYTRMSQSEQMFRLEKYKNLLPISTTILDDLKKLKVNKTIGRITLSTGTFFIVATRKEFEEGETLMFDDVQKAIRYDTRIKHDEFPKELKEFV